MNEQIFNGQLGKHLEKNPDRKGAPWATKIALHDKIYFLTEDPLDPNLVLPVGVKHSVLCIRGRDQQIIGFLEADRELKIFPFLYDEFMVQMDIWNAESRARLKHDIRALRIQEAFRKKSFRTSSMKEIDSRITDELSRLDFPGFLEWAWIGYPIEAGTPETNRLQMELTTHIISLMIRRKMEGL